MWVLSFFIFTGLVLILNEEVYEENTCQLYYLIEYVITVDLLAIIFPITILVTINVLIIIALKKRSNKVFQMPANYTLSSGISVIELTGKNKKTAPNENISSVRTNAVKIVSKNRKAYIYAIVISMSIICCWLPFTITWLMVPLCEDCVPSKVFEFAYWLSYSNSLFNPIFLIIFSDVYKNHLKNFFKMFIGLKKKFFK
jgi:hypothetical protein